MKTKRILLILGIVLVACALAFAFYNNSAQAIADEPVGLNGATILEAYFQALPEERATADAVKIPIIIYHSVRPIDPKDSSEVKSYEISPEMFEKQLEYLRDNGYTPISLDQVNDMLTQHTSASITKPVVLTFDDGWANQYRYAFPLLKKYHMTGTFYVYTNAIGVDHWMTWDQLKEMQAAGMSIESHSVSHPLFKGLSPAQAKMEVTKSKQILEQHLGVPIDHFASPYGYSSPALIALAKAAGYKTYRTTYKGIEQDDPMRLRGILVTNNFEYFVQELTR